jgi:hypothetical protein
MAVAERTRFEGDERRRLSWLEHVGIVAMLGLAIRVAYVLTLAEDPPGLGDAAELHGLANVIADGHGFVSPFAALESAAPTAHKPPLYPWCSRSSRWQAARLRSPTSSRRGDGHRHRCRRRLHRAPPGGSAGGRGRGRARGRLPSLRRSRRVTAQRDAVHAARRRRGARGAVGARSPDAAPSLGCRSDDRADGSDPERGVLLLLLLAVPVAASARTRRLLATLAALGACLLVLARGSSGAGRCSTGPSPSRPAAETSSRARTAT